MKAYQIADTTNGVLETYANLELASLVLDTYVTDGIMEELLIQDETGLTLDEIAAKVRDFYRLIEIEQ